MHYEDFSLEPIDLFGIGCASSDGRKQHFDQARNSKKHEACIALTRLCEVSKVNWRPEIDGC
jgi:hypothetical protein